MILMKKKKKNYNKAMIEILPKTGVEQTKNNGKFYLYFYPMGIQVKKKN